MTPIVLTNCSNPPPSLASNGVNGDAARSTSDGILIANAGATTEHINSANATSRIDSDECNIIA